MDDPPEVIVRTPVIPGFNDTRQDILAISDYLQSIGQTRHELLRYHRYGQSKYEKLGRQYPMGDAVLDDAAWQELTMLHSQLF
jgi:pyruvate formate lyase activating enzyme